MKKILPAFTLLWLLTAASLHAHHVPPQRDYHNPGPVPANVEHITITSRYLNPDNNQVGFAVYTPPGYEDPGSTTRYPVIYLLHGIQGNERNYFGFWHDFDSLYTTASALSLIEGTIPTTLTMPQAIVVFVNGRAHSFYNDFTDEFHGPGSPDPILTERILLKEVIPTVDARYRTIANRAGRAIEGFSMGGHGALKLAFDYPHVFCSTIAYGGAPYNDIDLGGDYPYSGPIPADNNVMSLAESHREAILTHQLQIALVVGDRDNGQRGRNLALHDLLNTLAIPHEYVPELANTRHNWFDYYQGYGEIGLNFHQECFERAAASLVPPRDTAVSYPALARKTHSRR